MFIFSILDICTKEVSEFGKSKVLEENSETMASKANASRLEKWAERHQHLAEDARHKAEEARKCEEQKQAAKEAKGKKKKQKEPHKG